MQRQTQRTQKHVHGIQARHRHEPVKAHQACNMALYLLDSVDTPVRTGGLRHAANQMHGSLHHSISARLCK